MAVEEKPGEACMALRERERERESCGRNTGVSDGHIKWKEVQRLSGRCKRSSS